MIRKFTISLLLLLAIFALPVRSRTLASSHPTTKLACTCSALERQACAQYGYACGYDPDTRTCSCI